MEIILRKISDLKNYANNARTHSRDQIVFGGKLKQDYNFLNYRFRAAAGDIQARVYLDDMWEVSITEPIDLEVLPVDVLAYLQARFRVIKQLGGSNGYRVIWRKPAKRH
jgi:hypothetical protein